MAIDVDRALKALGELEALGARTRIVFEGLKEGESAVGAMRREVSEFTRKREAVKQALADEEAHLAKVTNEAQNRHRSEMDKLDKTLIVHQAQLGTVRDNLTLAQERLAAVERQANEMAETRRKALDTQIGDLERAGRGRIAALAQQEADLLKRVQTAQQRLAKLEEDERALRSRAATIAGRQG